MSAYRTLAPWAELFRSGNSVTGIFGVALGSILASQGLPSGDFAIITALHCLSVMTFMFSWNALNDYMDIEIDRINRPDRPSPRGRFLKLQLVGILLLQSLGPLSDSRSLRLP
ncbi:MAG: hypothetical protein Ct9H90mP24_5970 [Methanobacteriota archaeon]|nr:MAG: hypothetical protein Ct9H90mP24_5970 [Euryarchaeota archaeon]